MIQLAHKHATLSREEAAAVEKEIGEIWKAVRKKKLSYAEAIQLTKETWIEALAEKSYRNEARGLL